jgi:hypothetical protein
MPLKPQQMLGFHFLGAPLGANGSGSKVVEQEIKFDF